MNLISNYINLETFIPIYLLSINIIAFIVFGIDKWRAQNHKWRISEFLLIFISIIGGATGALMAMSVFKHKSSKKKFYIGLPILIFLHWILIFYVINM